MFNFIGTRKPDFKNIDENVYDHYWSGVGYKMREKLMEREEIFLDWIKDSSRVLSIGCGNSRLLYELKNKKGCTVIGIDIAESVVAGLRKEGIECIRQDISEKDFDLSKLFSERFDYIIMSEILEHLALPELLIRNAASHADTLVISIPNSAFYRYRVGITFRGRFFTQWIKHPSEHLRYWSHIDFLDWLAAMGLEVLEAKPSNGPAYLRDIWPNMFGHQICYMAKHT